MTTRPEPSEAAMEAARAVIESHYDECSCVGLYVDRLAPAFDAFAAEAVRERDAFATRPAAGEVAKARAAFYEAARAEADHVAAMRLSEGQQHDIDLAVDLEAEKWEAHAALLSAESRAGEVPS